MFKNTCILALFTITVMLLLGMAVPESVFAQGCAMCGTALSGDDPVTQGFNWSIAFLMMMPYVVFAAVAGCVLYMRRRHMNQIEAAS